MNCRKGLSLLLALALVFSPLSALGTVAYAEETAAGNAIVEEVDEKEPATSADFETSENSGENVDSENVDNENIDNEDVDSEDAGDEDVDSGNVDNENAGNEDADGEDVDNENADSEDADGEDADNENAGGENADGENADNEDADNGIMLTSLEGGEDEGDGEDDGEYGIAPASLLPLNGYESAYLYLDGMSEDALKKVTLQQVKDNLYYSNGAKVEFTNSQKVIWGFYKTENGEQTEDEFHELGEGDKIDATLYSSNGYRQPTYYMTLYVSETGHQLDYEATRYRVYVYTSSSIYETVSFRVYDEAGQPVEAATTSSYNNSIVRKSELSSELLPVNDVEWYIKKDPEQDFNVQLSSSIKQSRSDIDVKVYPLTVVQEYLAAGAESALDESKAIEDIWASPHQADYTKVPDKADAGNAFCIVYSKGDEVIAYRAFTLVLRNANIFLTCDVYNAAGKSVTDPDNSYDGKYNVGWDLNVTGETVDKWWASDPYYDQYFSRYLQEGLSRNDPYYISFQADLPVKAVYLGRFRSEEDAIRAGAANVKEDILKPRDTAPFGYLAPSLSSTLYFTVVYENGSVLVERVYAYETSTNTDRPTEYVDGPLQNNETDPYFNLTGAAEYRRKTYAIQNNYNDMLDTLYNHGYQTVLIMDPEADLTNITPTFSGDGIARYDLEHGGTEFKSGEATMDFSGDEPLQIAVTTHDHVRNYKIDYVKMVTGKGELFVNGPDTREVFLTGYLEDRHDILIANIGDQPLTNVTVDLVEAQNVKLDDYWTIHKEDRLAAFTSVSASSTYGELNNLAKVRLLPDGEGQISGKLVFKVNDVPVRTITLTGWAANPQFVTEEIPKGVKFVPYSHIIATDDMNYDWNKPTYQIIAGSVPGMTIVPATGEIYGVPTQSGEFPITVQATFSSVLFTPIQKEFTVTVQDNADTIVFNSSDYELTDWVGEMYSGGRVGEYILPAITGDEMFVSAGDFDKFVDFWFNGEKLRADEYDKESGSTRITLKAETLSKHAVSGRNTLAAEFRLYGPKEEYGPEDTLLRTAQNFYLPADKTPSSGSGSSGGSNNTADTADEEDDTASTSAAGSAAPAASADVPQYATLTVRVTDANGAGLSGLTVELHSTPRSAVTNANGYVTFSNVPFGAHTLYVKNASGQTMASRSFVFGGSTTIGISGGNVLAAPGGAISLTVSLNGNTLNFVSAIPQTGDDFDPALYTVLALCSAAGLLGLGAWRKRRAATR